MPTTRPDHPSTRDKGPLAAGSTRTLRLLLAILLLSTLLATLLTTAQNSANAEADALATAATEETDRRHDRKGDRANRPPKAKKDRYETREDNQLVVDAESGVLTNDTDPDRGDKKRLSAALETAPKNGTISLAEDGSFTYTPNENFAGTDSFTYTASDPGSAESPPAKVRITVQSVNDAPVAENDKYPARAGETTIIPAPGLLANDTDPESDPLEVVSYSQPRNGNTVTVNQDGSVAFEARPRAKGRVSFTYTISDNQGGVAAATATFKIQRASEE